MNVETTISMTDNCCRYCLESSGTLISPCVCKGTQGFIHIACQQQGYNVNNDTKCPICKCHFYNIFEDPLEDIDMCITNILTRASLCIPCINIFMSMNIFINLIGLFTPINTEMHLAVFQLIWQIGILTGLLTYTLVECVKNRAKYIHYMFWNGINTPINMQLALWAYFIIEISRSDRPTYQFLLFASQCLMHIHVFRHVDVLQQINFEREVIFQETFAIPDE